MPDVSLWGAVYPDVTEVELPVDGGGTALFAYGGVSPVTLQPVVIRPDAELMHVWSEDAMVEADLGWTIPAYSTTAKTIHTGSAQSETYTIDYSYNWFIVEKLLLTPEYTTGDTPVKGKPAYAAGCVMYEVLEIPANTCTWGGKSYGSRSVTTTQRGTCYREPYFTSTTAISVYTSTTYGMGQTAVAPTVSSGAITVSDPTMVIRGSTTYFTSAVWGTMTDIRRQWRIELWRAPKEPSINDGWSGTQGLMHIIADAQGTTGKLT